MSERAPESTFSGHVGRVLRTAPLPLFGLALFGALGPFARLLARPGYRAVDSELYFVLPPVGDALLLGCGCLGLWWLERRAQRAASEGPPVEFRRALRGAPTALFIVFAGAQLFGLLQVIDRTPRGFPWVFFLALTLAGLISGVALTRRGLRLTSWRCFTSQIAAHGVLMFPGLLWMSSQALERPLETHYPGLGAGLCWLALVGLLWAGRRRSRWLDAASLALCVLTLLAAAPIYLSVRMERSYLMNAGERCEAELVFVPAWRAGPGHDPVCEPGALAWISWGQSALIGAAGLGGLAWCLRRRASIARA